MYRASRVSGRIVHFGSGTWRLAMALSAAMAGAAVLASQDPAPRPNILLVVSDDMGWGQPGFNGGTEVETPSLDRIANEGVKLTQFYAAPSCLPTRSSLMSGRYHWKTGNRDEDRSGNTTVGMLLDERTIAEALRDAGYATWIVGKWHLGQWHQAHLPLQRGFDHHFGHYSGFINYYRHRQGSILDWHRNGRPVVEEGYSTFLLAEEAIQLIGRHDGGRPFFLYLAFNAVHGPNGVPDEYLEPYAHVQSNGQRAQRGQLKAMDDALGWVVDALERKGVLDDTLVVFFNDNGGPHRAGGNRPYRGGKARYSEGGIRVPAAMRWPGRIPQGSETDALLHVVDLFPTLAGVAGASTSGGLPLDGLDAWQTIAAGAASPRDEVVHSPKVIRSGDWKLIGRDGESYGSRWASSLQLYDIAGDPYEETNLASSEAAKVAELQGRLDHHRQFARAPATFTAMPASAAVYGKVENAAHAAGIRTALGQLDAGNPGPVLLRLEASGASAKLVFNETLDSGSVPPASAFRVVALPGYAAVDVTGVDVNASDVLLTLAQEVGRSETVGLTYEVPDTGAVRDADSLAADGVTWVTAEPDGSLVEGPLTATFEGGPSSHDGLSAFTLRLRFSEAVSTSEATLRDLAIGVTGGVVGEARRVAGLSWLWDLTLLPSGPAEITVTLPATASCSDTGAVCTAAGKALANSPQLTVPAMPAVSIAAPSATATEGSQAAFEVTLSAAMPLALTVAVSVSETGSTLSGPPPAWVTVPQGDTSAVLSVPTALDAATEADSTVTASLVAGPGYVLGAATSASITVEDAPVPAGMFPRPNIVVILSDDMGWGQPGFNGGTRVETPSLDRIANEGVKLTQFYVQPVCSPTRASLLTGRYPWKNGMEVRPTRGSRHGMLTDERTIAEALRDAGYATWIVGKWHLGHWDRQHLPLQRGFDHHYGLYSGGTDYFTRVRHGILDWHRNERPVVESGYATFLLAEEAVQLVKRHDGSSPFFLYLPFNAVHVPDQAPPEYVAPYRHLRNPAKHGQLKAMDDAIGRVLDALEETHALDDTLVVFLNDNGGDYAAGGNQPYRGMKSSYHEGGIRVPAALRWPDEIPANSETDALLHAVDLFPTFAGLAGAAPESGLPLDGLDAWEAITGDATSPRNEVVHSLDVIRVGDWKLIESDASYYEWSSGGLQLYNIAEDPYERSNLAATRAAKVAELRARLAHHAPFARQGEPPERNPDHPPVVLGAEENAAYGAEVERALVEFKAGNLGPALLRLEAAGDRVKLVYDEALDTGSVPPADAFTVVSNPGYAGVGVTDVAVGGTEVVLTLRESLALGKTVGLTYEVPDSGAIRDVDRLDAAGVTWVTAPVSAALLGRDATLAASFGSAPASHDGSTDFTVRIRFTEALPEGSKDRIRRALSVTGGAAKTIFRVRSRLDLWEVNVKPSGTDAVTLSLASTGACGEEAAICTSDGRALSNTPRVTVDGPVPLTASFGSEPSEHDGSTDFTVRLSFSEALPQGSKPGLRRALSVTGGTRKTVLRVNDRLDRWDVKVAPSGNAAVRLSLASAGACGDEAAICTSDGRALSNTPSRTVDGPSAAGASANGAIVTLEWGSPRDDFGSPSGGDYGVRVNGEPRGVVSAALSGSTAWLALAAPVAAGDTVTVAYVGSAMHPLADATGTVRSGPWDGLAAENRTGVEPVAAPVVVADSRPADPLAAAAHDAVRLDASGLGLAGLRELERLAALERLDLSGNRVSDLSPLAGLADLRDLDLSGNRIADLWPLAGLYGLERLDLSRNGVTDVQALAGLANLTVLLLDGNAVADLGPLTHLEALENLGLGGNRVGDVTALQDLPRLRRLDLAGNPAADISPLGDVGSLVWLALPGHRVGASPDTLGRLTRLGWVWFASDGTARTDDAVSVR